MVSWLNGRREIVSYGERLDGLCYGYKADKNEDILCGRE